MVVLGLSGELDVGSQAATTATIEEALSHLPRALVLDLTAVEFLGSAGLSALIDAYRKAEAMGVTFSLVAHRRTTMLPLELTGLTMLFSIHPTVDSAVAASR